MLILCFILFFAMQTLVLFCCAAAGNDPVSQAISDQEQMEFLRNWRECHHADYK